VYLRCKPWIDLLCDHVLNINKCQRLKERDSLEHSVEALSRPAT